MPRRKIPLAEKFWRHVSRTTGSACWLWQGAKFAGKGYGMLNENRRPVGAHRVSWRLHHGKIPAGLWVLHKCDVRACVNPAHLFLGTHRDNMNDMVNKQRAAVGDRNGSRLHPLNMPRGERHGSRLHPECLVRGEQQHDAKLTADDVRKIRKLVANGVSQTSLASRFGVTQANISSVVLRKTWRHVL